jgi:hypothetical protein
VLEVKRSNKFVLIAFVGLMASAMVVMGIAFRAAVQHEAQISTLSVTSLSQCSAPSIQYDSAVLREKIIENQLPKIKTLKVKLGADNSPKLPFEEIDEVAYGTLNEFKLENPDCCEFVDEYQEKYETASHPTQIEKKNGWSRVFVMIWDKKYINHQGGKSVLDNIKGKRVFLVSNCGEFTPAQLPSQCVTDQCKGG